MRSKQLLLAVALVGATASLASLRSPAHSPLAAVPAGGAATYVVDPVHSSLVFRVMHLETAWFFGRFNELSGTIRYEEAEPERSSVELEVVATSVDTGNKNRDDHLRGSDFLESKQFPKITFKSTSAKALGEGRLELSGDLTLRGHTETIRFQVEKTGEGKNRQGQALIGFLGEFEVDRMAHGVSYMPSGLGEKVTVIVSLEAALRGEDR